MGNQQSGTGSKSPLGGPWIGLFSGGKDSSFAVYQALEAGLPVERLVTVHPPEDSYLYHVPATSVTGLAASSIGISHMEIDARSATTDSADSTERGAVEIEPLQQAIRNLECDPEGFVIGAVESEYQRDRIEALATEFGADIFAPLWGAEPVTTLRTMHADGFEIVVLSVSAAGFDATWLGRTLDGDAIDDLESLAEGYGVHPMGEGGEFETFVTDGPHMSRSIVLEGAPEWRDDRGRYVVTEARLEPPAP